MVRSRPATDVRLQPSRSATGVQGSRAPRSAMRHVLLGHRDDRGRQLQPSDRRRARGEGARRREAGPGTRGRREPGRARDHRAVAKRHSADPQAKREALDQAYANAMPEVARQFPDDLEANTFFADSMMNLRPWNLWTREGTPQPGTEELVQTLERVLARNPNHPGALHLYIHAVEASTQPERAEPAADRLLPLMPGAGHMVHMPSHIYWRVGRYTDAVNSNAKAVLADRAYFKTAQPSMIYRGLYYPHNIDFIWHSASMQGRNAETNRAAREFADNAPAEMIKAMPDMETAPAAPIAALVRFGRWAEVLAYPAPPREWLYTTGVWRYARGISFNAKGYAADAAR